jgi:ABC-type glutathione transport system ATPase component
VNLEVAAGTTVGLVGESGSGKSTLARCVVGLVRATQGQIRLDSHDVTNSRGNALASVRGTVQLVFQDPRSSLDPRLEVGAAVVEAVNLGTGPRLTARDSRAAAWELFETVGLSRGLAQRYPHQLSGGQLQRVAIARALARKPRLLLLDEVTSSLDMSVQARILNLLQALQREFDLSMLYISHDLSVVRYLSDHLYVMRQGEIVEHGSVDEVFGAPKQPYTQALLAAVPTLGGNRWRRRAHAALS